MTAVEVGEIVWLTDLNSEPALLILNVDAHLTGVLLADLAAVTIQRLEDTISNHEGRREIATAVANAEDIMSFAVPSDEVPIATRVDTGLCNS